MIKLEPDNDGTETQHFIIRADQPVTIEVMVHHGRAVAHVYATTTPDVDTAPVGAYDGSMHRNDPWEYEA